MSATAVRYRAHLEPVPADAEADDDPTGWKAIDELIGFIKDGPTEPIGWDHDTRNCRCVSRRCILPRLPIHENAYEQR